MFRHRLDEPLSLSTASHWFLLSFAAGCINAGGFLATGRFVSHVTGFATLFGVELAQGRASTALGILSVPLFFLLGAFIAGSLTEVRSSRGLAPRFDFVMALSATCLFLVAASGELAHTATFGDIERLRDAYVLLALVCMAAGLQNAAISSASRRSVRVTHLTGLTTDLGLGLARLLQRNASSRAIADEIRANWLRVGSIAAFVLGSAGGAALFVNTGFHGFVVPGLIAAYAAFKGYRESRTAI